MLNKSEWIYQLLRYLLSIYHNLNLPSFSFPTRLLFSWTLTARLVTTGCHLSWLPFTRTRGHSPFQSSTGSNGTTSALTLSMPKVTAKFSQGFFRIELCLAHNYFLEVFNLMEKPYSSSNSTWFQSIVSSSLSCDAKRPHES